MNTGDLFFLAGAAVRGLAAATRTLQRNLFAPRRWGRGDLLPAVVLFAGGGLVGAAAVMLALPEGRARVRRAIAALRGEHPSAPPPATLVSDEGDAEAQDRAELDGLRNGVSRPAASAPAAGDVMV